MTRRGRLSFVALVVLVVYLLAFSLKVAEENRELQRQNRQAIAEVTDTQDDVVNKLAEILAQAIRAENAAREAGVEPRTTVRAILEKVEGLDPELIDRALDEARRTVEEGEQGPPGPQGPAGPPGTSPPAPDSTTTSTSSTTTTRPAPTTTSTTTSTTTTRPCTIRVLGIGVLC